MGILAKTKSNVPSVILRKLYFTLLQPYLEYCNIVWATGTSVMLNKLLVVRIKVLRMITNSPWNTHAPPIFIKLGILTVFNINKLQTAFFMYMVMNNLVPSFFVKMFTVNSAIYNYDTLQKNNLLVPSYRTTVRKHSVSVCGVNMWNDIPEQVKEFKTCNQFKLKYKRYCFVKTTLDTLHLKTVVCC